MTQYGFYFDQSRCIGCNACTVACKQWNGLPPGPIKWMRVYQWERGTFPDIKLNFLAIPCYHCERPICMEACPNGAIFKEDHYGAVLIDAKRCEGKRQCWKACPYGSIMFASDEPSQKASKCTMCIDRLNEGRTPICVLSCSMRALEFGPLHELRMKFGDARELEEMPSGKRTHPSVVMRASQPKKPIVTWKADKALSLWKSRGPHAPLGTPDLFEKEKDLTEIPAGTIGRDRLILKAKSVEELMYFTTDND